MQSVIDGLHDFPVGVSPDYKPIPVLIRAVINLLSIFISLCWSKVSLSSISRIVSWRDVRIKVLLKLFVQAWCLSFMATTFLQDLAFGPSRIPLSRQLEEFKLGSRDLLPSQYSNLENVKTSNLIASSSFNDSTDIIKNEDSYSLTTHFLRVQGTPVDFDAKRNDQTVFDVLHCSHGFGASSLSWLPALLPLVNTFRANTGLAHDAVGFGFTERPDDKNNLDKYSLAISAGIGLSLIHHEMEEIRKHCHGSRSSSTSRILLLGHSMGCASTLRMALNMHSIYDSIKIILVSPAIIAQKSGATKRNNRKNEKLLKNIRFPSLLKRGFFWTRHILVDVPFAYLLRRLVSSPSFWKRGLSSAWGDPKRLNEKDIRRFRWPAIASNLESGLLAFARAQVQKIDAYDGGDLQLLKDVVDLPNIDVTIVHGTKDLIVPITNSEQLVKIIGETRIQLLTMDGLGHDPFEENVDEFIDIIS